MNPLELVTADQHSAVVAAACATGVAGRGQAIVAAAGTLLAPGGTLLVYEWVLDDAGDGPVAVAPASAP